MIFENVAFYENVQVGTDPLQNPIYEESEIGSFSSALTQWTIEEIALLDRAVTQSNRKLITHAPVEVLKRATHIYINDIKYTDIMLKSDFRRWRLCHVKEYKE